MVFGSIQNANNAFSFEAMEKLFSLILVQVRVLQVHVVYQHTNQFFRLVQRFLRFLGSGKISHLIICISIICIPKLVKYTPFQTRMAVEWIPHKTYGFEILLILTRIMDLKNTDFSSKNEKQGCHLKKSSVSINISLRNNER